MPNTIATNGHDHLDVFMGTPEKFRYGLHIVTCMNWGGREEKPATLCEKQGANGRAGMKKGPQ
jgi:hypothetical protein